MYFFSTRQQIDQKWGTPQPITIRDKDFGAVRLRAFGNYAFRIADPKLFHTEILRHARVLHRGRPGRASCAAWCCRTSAPPLRPAASRFPDLAANQDVCQRDGPTQLAPAFAKIGLKLEAMTVQNVSLPGRLQKILDQKIGMGMVGNDMGKFMQYQTAQSIPKFAEAAGAVAALRRRHGPGRRCGPGPGAGAEPAGRRCRARRRWLRQLRPRPPGTVGPTT